jgi:hypothetical protein
MRFAIDTDYLPDDIEAIPSIKEVKLSPTIISLGEDLGKRATLTVTFKDHKHVFAGESYDSGTFWGKFRARYGLKLRGYAIRLITGLVGDALADMEQRHYLIESGDGPTPDGEYQIIAKDVLKLTDGDRAQAPSLSNGFLSTNITAVATTLTLSPAGIGNAEYPAGTSPPTDYVAIGGKEICGFTRSGDVLTITRAQFNTVAQAHEASDRVQLCLEFSAQDPAVIIAQLLVNYANVDQAFVDGATWLSETDNFLGTLYSALIAEPTDVSKLISELIEQAALALWWDDERELIRLQVLRAISTTADEFTPENYMDGSLDVREQPEKRISQVWTYFGKINPLIKDDQIDNYRSNAKTIDDVAEAEYGTPAIKKIFSRWIPAGGRSVADRLNDIQLARYRDPPRRFNFDVMRYAGQEPVLGGGYQLEGQPFQDITGALAQIPIQITRLNPGAAVIELEAEEMLFQAIDADPTDRVLIIDSNFNNYNVRTVHDSLYPAPESGDTVTVIINTGVIVGSTSTALRSFDVGSWPAGVTVNVTVNGRIEGAGGAGGNSTSGTPEAGSLGGPALYPRYSTNLTSTSGQIWGGGGGGGGGNFGGSGNGGGGGAGQVPGAGGSGLASNGSPGTTEAGGAGGISAGSPGGTGGGPGLAGQTSTAAGGAAGAAIDGDSFVTDVGGIGDIRGAQIN